MLGGKSFNISSNVKKLIFVRCNIFFFIFFEQENKNMIIIKINICSIYLIIEYKTSLFIVTEYLDLSSDNHIFSK